MTPNKSSADFSAMNELPEATVQYSMSYKKGKDGEEADVHLKNVGDTLAFFIEMRIVGKSGQTLTPVIWDDNYVSLPPHSERVYTAHLPPGEKGQLRLKGWNVRFDSP